MSETTLATGPVEVKADCIDREVDKDYLALLERKLDSVKNPKGNKATVKQFISDIASVKDHQLFNLLTDTTLEKKFDDDFSDLVIQPSFIQRKIAPQTCAISTSEKLKLVKNDHVQKVADHLEDIEIQHNKVSATGEWNKFDETKQVTLEKSKKD